VAFGHVAFGDMVAFSKLGLTTQPKFARDSTQVVIGVNVAADEVSKLWL
jgi:hypothetical protein